MEEKVALSLNKVMLIGHLGRDAETRFSNDNSIAITSFAIATSRSSKGKDGNWVNESTWHNIVGFNLNDWVRDGLKKGTRVYVEGRIQIRDYTKQDNTPGRVFEIIAERIQLVDKKTDSEQSPFEAYGGGNSTGNTNTESGPAQTAPDEDLPF